MSPGLAPENESSNPFPGLRPFLPGEEHLFFGRENQVDTMVDKLARSRFLAVVGTSGSGKSSLVNCGLRPALHRGLMRPSREYGYTGEEGNAWRIAQFRPGGNPLRAMARALAGNGVLFGNTGLDIPLEGMVESALRSSKVGISTVYELANPAGRPRLLVIADQFEELFRFRHMKGDPARTERQVAEDSAAFVNLLLDAYSQPDFPIYVVITMRSDFLGDCSEFTGLPEAINQGQYLVPRLTRDERRMAVAGPVGVAGGRISPVLVTQLVNDAGDNPDQLSVLQHALNRTWMRWKSEGGGVGEMSPEHYEAIGTMARALDQHADKAFNELTSDHLKDICERVFQALTETTPDGRSIRRPTTMGTLCAVAEASPQEVTEVLAVFRKPSRSFIMPPVPEPLTPDTVIDISHESLMRVWERLKNWVADEAQSVRRYRRLSETARMHAIEPAYLRDPELQNSLDWRGRTKPTKAWADRYGGYFEETMRLLDDSTAVRMSERLAAVASHERELRRAKHLRIGVAAAVVLFVGTIVFSIGWTQRMALQAARSADRHKGAEISRLLRTQTAAGKAQSEWEALDDQLEREPDPENRKVIADKKAAAALKAYQTRMQAKDLALSTLALAAGGRTLTGTDADRQGLFSKDVQLASSTGGKDLARMFGPVNWDGPFAQFADGKPSGFIHWVEWRTKSAVKVRSVSLFAFQDSDIDFDDPSYVAMAYQVNRAFEKVRVLARKGTSMPAVLVDFDPPLPYMQTLPFHLGTSLAFCFDVSPVTASEFRAEFTQAADGSGPRIVKLDASSSTCQ